MIDKEGRNMPMYFPDLESVKQLAKNMSIHQKEENKYFGIIPKKEEDLPQARKELGEYFRNVWKDEVQALEVELAVSEENYDEKMQQAIMNKFLQ